MSEQEQSKTGLIYFECSSMRELYDCLENWQNTNHKRLISLSTQKEGKKLSCIALINPDDITQPLAPKTLFRADMERFRRKALKHIGVAISFESSAIPHQKLLTIQSKLEECTTPEEVKAVFAEEL
jgi:hypothetical protein